MPLSVSLPLSYSLSLLLSCSPSPLPPYTLSSLLLPSLPPSLTLDICIQKLATRWNSKKFRVKDLRINPIKPLK